MSDFTLISIEGIKQTTTIFKLAINGKCLFDEFEASVKKEKQYTEELESMYAVIEDLAEGLEVPKKRFKQLIRPKKDQTPDYEIISKHLRIYLFKANCGRIIVLGGKKTTQTKDLKRFRRIKKEYINHNNKPKP